MFARTLRLPSSIHFSSARIWHTPFFSLRVIANTLLHNRYGFIVGKGVDKRATVRNRLKRRFRGVLERLHPNLSQGKDMLFVLKKEAIDASTDQLQKVVTNTLQK